MMQMDFLKLEMRGNDWAVIMMCAPIVLFPGLTPVWGKEALQAPAIMSCF